METRAWVPDTRGHVHAHTRAHRPREGRVSHQEDGRGEGQAAKLQGPGARRPGTRPQPGCAVSTRVPRRREVPRPLRRIALTPRSRSHVCCLIFTIFLGMLYVLEHMQFPRRG